MGGQPWLNQQWGAQVLLGALYRLAGWPGVMVARGLLIGGIAALLYLACRGRGARPRTAALLTLGGWLSGIEILGQMRPQLFGMLLFSVCVWALATRGEHPMRIWLVPIAVVPWANLHGSFPLAIVLLGFAWLEDRRERPALARRALIAAGASLLASLLNPYGLRAWSYIWDLSTNPVVSRQVSEWGPPSIHTWTGFFFFASLFAVGALVARRERRVGWLPLLELATFAVLALLASRAVAWWGLYAPVVVAGLLADGVPQRQTDAAIEDRSPMSAIIIGMLIVLALIAIPTRFGTDPITGGPAALVFAPQHLIDVAQRCAEPGTHVYSSQVYSSWSEFSAPDLPLMVDSRIEIFPIDVWRDYFTVTNGQDGWQDVLDRWNVGVLIVHRAQSQGLLDVIDRDPEWRKAFSGDEGDVYVRADASCLVPA